MPTRKSRRVRFCISSLLHFFVRAVCELHTDLHSGLLQPGYDLKRDDAASAFFVAFVSRCWR